jgi:Immunoglobulin-like domain of bacterial spore germination
VGAASRVRRRTLCAREERLLLATRERCDGRGKDAGLRVARRSHGTRQAKRPAELGPERVTTTHGHWGVTDKKSFRAQDEFFAQEKLCAQDRVRISLNTTGVGGGRPAGPLLRGGSPVRRTRTKYVAAALATISVVLTACSAGDGGEDVCANADNALSRVGFIFVDDPRSGERVSSGFRVTGCSSTFEASVNWQLRDRAGETLASGVTQGGSLEPSSFEFTVEYSIATRQVGELEVYEPRVTTEGFPPSRDVVPLVLEPSGQ